MKYDKPAVVRFGHFRDITQAGCTGTSDGQTFMGSGPSVGNVPRITDGTTDFCFTNRGSR